MIIQRKSMYPVVSDDMELIEKSDVIYVGTPKHRKQKFVEYAKAIEPYINILQEDIEKDKNREGNITGIGSKKFTTKNMAKMLGPYFENNHYKSIYNGLRYVLWKYDIAVEVHTSNTGNKYFLMRKRQESDKLSLGGQSRE